MNGHSPVVPGAEPFRLDGGATGVLMIHGFTGSPASMRPIGEWLAGRGLSVLGPRLPGHGTSWQDLETRVWTDWAAEVDAGLSLLLRTCERVVVVAQSMGGSLAIHVAATRGSDVAGLALMNPYIRDSRLALLPFARFFIRTVKGIGNDISKPGGDEVCYDRMPVRALASMRRLLLTADRELPEVTAPLLVFRSGADHVIPKGNPERVVQRAGSTRKELVECPSSFHVVSLDHDAPMVRRRILDLIESIPPPP